MQHWIQHGARLIQVCHKYYWPAYQLHLTFLYLSQVTRCNFFGRKQKHTRSCELQNRFGFLNSLLDFPTPSSISVSMLQPLITLRHRGKHLSVVDSQDTFLHELGHRCPVDKSFSKELKTCSFQPWFEPRPNRTRLFRGRFWGALPHVAGRGLHRAGEHSSWEKFSRFSFGFSGGS